VGDEETEVLTATREIYQLIVSSLKRIKKDTVGWFAKDGACADSGADASSSGV
jgi:hypothetical protein